jgi:hypothetical protein
VAAQQRQIETDPQRGSIAMSQDDRRKKLKNTKRTQGRPNPSESNKPVAIFRQIRQPDLINLCNARF